WDGRVGGEAVLGLAEGAAIVAAGLGADALLLEGAEVGGDDAAALAFGEEEPRLIEVLHDVEATAAADVGPIRVEDGALVVAAGAGPASVVLESAGEVVEGLGIIGEDLIELAERDVADPFPG